MKYEDKGDYDYIKSTTSRKVSDLPILDTIKDYLSLQPINISGQDAFDSLIYGLKCKRIIKGKSRHVVLLQQNALPFIITLINFAKKEIETIDLSQITHISFDDQSDNFKGYAHHPLSGKVVQLLNKKSSFDFYFSQEEQLITFLTGINTLFSFCDLFDTNDLAYQIKQIWFNYDKDFSKTLGKKEFLLFTQDVNIIFNENLDFDSTYNRIDSNKNGVIDFEEFVDFFRQYTDGHEYKEIFFSFLSNKHNTCLSSEEVQQFFRSKQKDDLSLLDVHKIIILHKQKLSKEQKADLIEKIEKNMELTKEESSLLSLTLEEFKLLLHSPIASVLNYQSMNEGQNMNRSINDYYINSTHNTYLTGHQLTSESSAEMYSISVLEGCRLVELDCYNGSGEDIIITHGYTLTSSLHLRDVLFQLKEHAFLNSSYPIILSIENHLDAYHQKIMTRMFKEILVDLYILPQEDVPDYLPSLIKMKNKFIIKCGGKRIQKDRAQIIPRAKLDYISNKDVDDYTPKESVKPEFKRAETFKIKEKDKSNEVVNTVDNNLMKRPKGNEITIHKLGLIRGLFGAKFKYDQITENNYQPWEMVSLKCDKASKFASDIVKRKTIIEFTQNSIMKVYPTGFNSSNYDPIKCWIVGCQIAAINIQSTQDDWTLLNMIFFVNNRNRGYVLKPKKLLPESIQIEAYEVPYGHIQIQIINLIGLSQVLKEANIVNGKSESIRIEWFIVGSEADDERNKTFIAKIEGDFLMPKIIVNEPIDFEIYEKDLSCIYIKVYYEKEVIGRSVIPLMIMKEGVRKIGLYDGNCIEINGSFIVADINKSYP